MIEADKTVIAAGLDEDRPRERLRRSVTLTVTHSCNLDCTYCYEPFKGSEVMPLSVAQAALRRHLSADGSHDEVLVDFAGGEPTLAFERLREICEWTWEQSWPVPYLFFATTNGTLVRGPMQEWFWKNRHRIWLALSLDGTREMHNANRSQSYDRIDIAFFRSTWPKQHVKMTVSRETLDSLAAGVVLLHQQGFRVQVNLAHGIDWTDPNAQSVLARELDTLVAYYLGDPEVEPCSVLAMPVSRVGLPVTERRKWCGAGTDMVAIDVDGREYPCHAFLPLTQGERACEALVIEWSDVESLRDPKCAGCILEPLCPTCYAISYMGSGHAGLRDRALCELSKIRALACSKLEAERIVRDRKATTSYDRGVLQAARGILRVQRAFGRANPA